VGAPPAPRFIWEAGSCNGGRSASFVEAARLPRQPEPWRFFIATNEPRINQQIRISPVRLIGADGEQIGIVPVDEALTLAREKNLDLVEVAASARPPVCKIMDYGRYKYEQAKAEREARKKQHVTQMKEIKMRPNIEEHDFDFKTRHIRRFLEERNKVKVTIMFRGREMAHTENGMEVLDDVIEEIGEMAIVEQAPRMEGRNLFLILAPSTKK
jgi:translation initiation factor IF-3